MKILNLYAGIGGNRKLWGEEHEITAVENDPIIARAYQDFFPKDRVIVGDAHEYLLKHYKEFDFIWSSPPCPTHSDIRRCGVHAGRYEAMYPDMKLYEEIIFLQHFSKCKWVVENVVSYYDPLIKPRVIQRHYFWSNFLLNKVKSSGRRVHNDIVGSEELYGFDISKTPISEKRKVLRNMVDPVLAKAVFDSAFLKVQRTLE